MFADRCKRARHNPVSNSMRSQKKGTTDSAYEEFHHGPSQHVRSVVVPDPPTDAYVIGRLVEVQYLPYLSSKKHHERYSHKFGDTGYSKDDNPTHMPLLLADKEGNLFISRDHSKYNINSRGIVG